MLLIVLVASCPLNAQTMPGPRVSAESVGLRPREMVKEPAPPLIRAHRARNNGWIIGAVIGGALGAYGGYHFWRGDHRLEAPSTSPAAYMLGFGLLFAAIGTVIGGVLGSK
jgi:hypothetical protein